MQVRKQQLELDMEQHIGSKLGKEYIKAVYCHPAYLASVQSISCVYVYPLPLEPPSHTPILPLQVIAEHQAPCDR